MKWEEARNDMRKIAIDNIKYILKQFGIRKEEIWGTDRE